MSEFRERFWERMCQYRLQLFLLFVLDVVLLLAALAALPFVDPGTASGVIVWVDIGLFGALLVPIGLVLYRCRQRSAEERF